MRKVFGRDVTKVYLFDDALLLPLLVCGLLLKSPRAFEISSWTGKELGRSPRCLQGPQSFRVVVQFLRRYGNPRERLVGFLDVAGEGMGVQSLREQQTHITPEARNLLVIGHDQTILVLLRREQSLLPVD